MSEPNRVVVKLTLDDTLAAYRLFGRRRLASHGIMFAALILGLAGFGLVALIGTRHPRMDDVAALSGALVTYGIVSLVCSSLCRSWLLRRRVKRIYHQQASLHDELIVEWGKTGLGLRSSIGVACIPWRRFIGRRENQNTILLYQSNAVFHFIPRRHLNGEQTNSLQDFLSQVPVKA